jgi:hypothetical protein
MPLLFEVDFDFKELARWLLHSDLHLQLDHCKSILNVYVVYDLVLAKSTIRI